MEGTGSITYRRAETGDMRPAFAVFRRSLVAYIHRIGLVESPDTTQAMIEEAWAQRGPWIEHLWRTAAENWVAEDAEHGVFGWAMSVERDGMLELTHFFVDPAVQSKGVGRALLDRAFPSDRARHRSILATHDPRALGLYLRSGVRHVTTVLDFSARPQATSVTSDLEIEPVATSPATIDAIAGIEAALLGHRREVDTAFILEQRPAWLARRAGEVVGFAFGGRDELTGPMGVLDPADMPALLAVVENHASESGTPEIYFSTPMSNTVAVEYLLGRGYRIDPFVAAALADDLSMRLDHWIHTGLSYIL